MKLEEIIKQAIDIHVHVGPEIIPRAYTVEKLLKDQEGKLAGCVLKNHFYNTTAFIAENAEKNLKLFGAVVLNNSVGGLNPEAVYATSLVSNKPFFVWFPTINAKNFLDKSDYEIAPEWVKKREFIARDANKVLGISVLKNGRLVRDALAVLEMIKQCNAVLATGHLSWKESEILVKRALKVGIKNIVITHPIYQRIAMPISVQKELAKKGCFMEISYSMYSMDGIPIKEIAKHIKQIGVRGVILSSDAGQPFSPSPSKALYQFGKLLIKNGIAQKDLYVMMVTNPRKLLNIAKQ